MANVRFSISDSNALSTTKRCITVAEVVALCMSSVSVDSASTYNMLNRPVLEYNIIRQNTYEGGEYMHMEFDGKKDSNKRILEKMSSLKENWDGYGGKSFSKESLAFYNSLIENILIQPTISPTGRGSLYLEYNGAKGMLGFEAFEKKVDMAFISNDGEIVSKSIDKNFYEEINQTVEKYYE